MPAPRAAGWLGPYSAKRLTVVSIDFVRFTTLVRNLEEGGAAPFVHLAATFKIQNEIQEAFRKNDVTLKPAAWMNTGDGGKYIFSDPVKAVSSAIQLQYDIHGFNERVPRLGYRHYRIGIATGACCLPRKKCTQFCISGLPLIVAARLETACSTGQILVCEDTFRKLPAELTGQGGWSVLKSQFRKKLVPGKDHEDVQYEARSLRVGARAKWDR